ncbi:MAG TPA: hypothetical protein VFO86_03460, partial [Terriglobia bacterium]|nr:hypothetical protein [Terriglobia bacterium]
MSSFLFINGDFAFSSTSNTVNLVNNSDLSDAGTQAVSVITIGGENLHGFVGVNGPYEFDSNGNGIIDDTDSPNANAMGFSFSDLNFALALIKPDPTTILDQRDWYALSANASDIQLVGIDNLVAHIHKLTVEINQGGGTKNALANSTVVNFSALPSGGLDVTTGPTGTIKLDFDSPLLRASADIELAVGDFFFVNGTFGFEESTQNFTLSDGSPIAASVLSIGATGASAFLGVNGPYLQDSNLDGKIDSSDTPNAAASGLSLTGINFALVLIRPTSTGPPSAAVTDKRDWLALKAHADSAELIGITGLTASATDINISINRGGGVNGVTPNDTVVNFSVLNGGGLSVPGTSLKLDFSGPLLEASATIELQIFDFVYARGSIAIHRGAPETITLSDNSTKLVQALTIGGDNITLFAGLNGPDTNSAAVGLKATGISFGVALFKPTDLNDASSYYAVKAHIGSL